MIRRPPRSTRTDTLFPYTTLFRSVQRLQVAVAQAETLHDAGAEILDQDIGGLDQIPHQIHGSRILKVERNAFLAGIQMAEIAAVAGAQRRSEERRVGKECVSTCRSRWSPYH